MIIPYSTDAPIYHFPWMTIGLIAVNGITFALTKMGLQNQGWLLTYGHGLHPLEWLAYNFLHFGPVHLVGNMFFLWSFGIVVEGKLGWWRFLSLYLGIGVLGGFLIQTVMLWHHSDDFVRVDPHPSHRWIWSDNTLYAQENVPGINLDDEDLDDPQMDRADGHRVNPNQGGRQNAEVPIDAAAEDETTEYRPGAGGASLIIYGLMAVVLIWAPRNEIHCLLMFGFRMAAIEVEYLYFCGFYIIVEIVSAVFSSRGFEVSSEVGHATGAMLGLGLGTLFVKQDWVDCEKWDLFSIMRGDHSAASQIAEWHNYYAPVRGDVNVAVGDVDNRSLDDPDLISKKKRKKAKPNCDNWKRSTKRSIHSRKQITMKLPWTTKAVKRLIGRLQSLVEAGKTRTIRLAPARVR